MGELEFEANLFNTHLEEWRETHMGKFVLIKGETIRFYTTLDGAFNAGIEAYGTGHFLVEQVLPKDVVHVTFMGQNL